MAVRKYWRRTQLLSLLPVSLTIHSRPKPGYPVQASNPIEELFEGIRSWGKRRIWTENSGVLSLTRTPTNSLMWSHYASEHRGMVVGFDVEISGFSDEESCLIPAQYGSVIYTQTRPVSSALSKPRAEPIEVGHTHYYPAGHHEKLSQLFLQKPMCWAYEEEVRVVKCISDRNADGVNASGQFELINDNDSERRLYCYKLPEGSIKKVYLGLRHEALSSHEKFLQFSDFVGKMHPGVEVKACRLSLTTWDIDVFTPYETRS